jgi:putative tryptophan/tyrosine transport system substrate-binding protein
MNSIRVNRPRLKRCATGLVAALVTLSIWVPASRAAEGVVVAVTAIEQHPALDACRDGVRDALKAAGYVSGKNLKFVYENAQGDPAAATAIARKFAKDKPTVIVPISTPSAQAVVAATVGIPVIFTAVTDPLGAKLVRNMNRPGANVTGISDLAPIKRQFDLIKQITPRARRIGVLFNPQESNSHTLIYLLKMNATNNLMSVVEAPVAQSSDVPAAAANLIGKVDVIFVPTDNTVIPMLEAVVKVGVDNRIPIYTGDIDSVKHGAMAAVGFDYYNVGFQTGNLVVRILKGESPATIPVRVVEETFLYVNPVAAAKMGVTIPEGIVAQADVVVR